VRIDKNIGDFDSLPYTPFPPPEEIYPTEKDYTDGEIAMRKMLDCGFDEIEIYGGGGKREDHFLGNLQLLYLAHSRGAIAKMVTSSSIIFVAHGRINLGEYCGKTLSVLPFGGELHILDSAGLKYAYPQKLGYGECRGISNIVQSANAHITFGEGTALILVNREEV
jgi:thiamine pyrophosphokinase